MTKPHPSNRIDSPGNRAAILKEMVAMADYLLKPEYTAAISLNPLRGAFHKTLVSKSPLPKDPAHRGLPQWMSDIAETAIESRSCTTKKIPARAAKGLPPNSPLKSVRYMVALPLFTRREEKAVAVLFLGYVKKEKLTEEDKSIFSFLSERFEPLLEGAWLLGRYQAIIAAGQKINQELQGPAEVLKQLYKEISGVLDTSYYISLTVYRPQTRSFEHYRYYKGVYSQAVGDYKGGCAYVLDTRKPFITSHYSKDSQTNPDFPDIYQIFDDGTPPAEFMAFIPLFYKKEPLGVLSMQHDKPKAFDEDDVQIIKLLGNQVALALNYLRLLDYMEQVNQSGKLLIHPLSAHTDLLPEVVNHIQEATKADIVVLYPYRFVAGQPTENCFDQAVEAGQLQQMDHVKLEVRVDDIANIALNKAAKTGFWEQWSPDSRTLYAELGGDPKTRLGYFEKRESIRSTAVLVLRAGDEPVGVLFVNFRKSQTFDPLQRLLITTLAYFTAIAIKNHQALQILRSADFKVLQTIDKKIGETLELDEIISTILELAVKHVSAADSAIYIYDQRSLSLKAMATRGTHEHLYLNSVVDLSKQNPAEPEGLIAKAFFERGPILEYDVRRSKDYKKGVPSTRAELDVPLIDPVNGESVGVINLESGVPYAFNEAHRDFMVTLAGQAVVALKNAQIYKRVTSLNSSLTAILDISRKIVSTQGNQEDAFLAILERAREFFKVEIAVLQLYETGIPGPSYIVKDKTPGVMKKIRRITPDPTKLGIIKHVAKTRKIFLTNDTDKEPLYRGSKVIKSELAVPMIFEGALIGVLDLESINPGVFTDDDVALIELFTTQAILVVQSASRLLEARSAAEVEHRRLTILTDATHELNAVKEPEQLETAYDIVIDKVAEFSTGEIIIRRYLPESKEFKLVRIFNQYEPSPEIIPEEGSWNGRARRERQVIAEQNLDDLPPEVPRPIAGNLVKSIVLAPVWFADSYYGTLTISHKEPNSFMLSDVNLLKAMATQLAVTLKRLEIVKTVRDTEKSNSEMSVLSNVGTVAMSISHDLSNSLAPVQFSTAALLNLLRKHLPKETPRRAKLLAEAEVAANTINEKMRKASDFTQRMKTTFISALQHRAEPQAVSVNMLLDGVIAKYKNDKTIKLTQEIQPSLGTIETSPALIEQVFDYLINNAKEAMRKSRGTITIRARRSRSNVIISVSDTGPGIKTSLLETVFMFGYTTKKRGRQKGTGFGLWHARGIVDSYKGTLKAKSQPGHGATFIITLPLTSKGDVFQL